MMLALVLTLVTAFVPVQQTDPVADWTRFTREEANRE